MPVQIAEIRQTGYIPLSLRKSSESFTRRMDVESEHTSRTWQTSESMDESSHRTHRVGRIFSEWRRTDSVGHSWHRKGITK